MTKQKNEVYKMCTLQYGAVKYTVYNTASYYKSIYYKELIISSQSEGEPFL